MLPFASKIGFTPRVSALYGAFFIVAGISLREADDEYLLLLSGIVALVFARALLSHLAGDAIVFSTWIGLYVLTLGVVLLRLTLRYCQPLWEGQP